MKNEIWKDIAGYEGWYQVSNMGRVRSLDRTVYFNSKSGKGSRFYKGQILKHKYHHGYQMVNLLKNKHLEVLYIHRLVIETFVPRVEGKTWCNHKNGIKSDNRAENLEWCTPSENKVHADKNGLHTNNVSGMLAYADTLKKKVVAIKNNKIIYSAECSRDMAKFLLENEIVKDVKIETLGRGIRKSAAEGNSYHGFNFQYV